jgi:hypothetical protein
MDLIWQEGTPMPTYDTPEPISATIEVAVGDVRISAGDRDATSVEVRASDATSGDDRKAAELTRVEYDDGRLLVKGPKSPWLRPTRGGSIDVTLELPAGSHLHGTGSSVDFDCAGRLGECRVKTGLGHVRLEQADTVSVKTGVGDISIGRATRHAEVAAGSGEVRLGELDTGAIVKNSNGDTWVGTAHGDLRVKAANGSIAIDAAHATVAAKSANGDVRLGEAVRGSVVLETQIGDVEVGIRAGTAAWLDVSASAGTVHNMLESADAPGPSVETVQVRARTSIGEITIRRHGGQVLEESR